jgi:hypothetical protein
MDSVYEAARTHAEKLKTELEALQSFLDLHDHFRSRFGLAAAAATPVAETSVSPSEAEAPVVDQDEAASTIEVQQPKVEADAGVAIEASKSEVVEPEEPVQAEAETSVEAVSEDEPLVIKASEGVLVAASSDAEAAAPLGPEATLQAVAEKLAATITASHPAVTGYTV